MLKHWLTVLGSLEEGFPNRSPEDAEFLSLVQAAKLEWQTAQNYFEHVSDPELVDYAIYKLEATCRRYMYLLKQARILGLQEKQILNTKTVANLS